MRVQGIGGNNRIAVINVDIEEIKSNLQKIADLHHIDVDTLLKDAKNAGDNAEPWQVRALNLEVRIKRLENMKGNS